MSDPAADLERRWQDVAAKLDALAAAGVQEGAEWDALSGELDRLEFAAALLERDYRSEGVRAVLRELAGEN